jgi:hypothetical protein
MRHRAWLAARFPSEVLCQEGVQVDSADSVSLPTPRIRQLGYFCHRASGSLTSHLCGLPLAGYSLPTNDGAELQGEYRVVGRAWFWNGPANSSSASGGLAIRRCHRSLFRHHARMSAGISIQK